MIKTEKSAGVHRIGSYSVIKKLAVSRFQIYLVSSPDNKRLVLKVYDLEENDSSPSFKNERRFTDFKHPNIINIVGNNCRAQEKLGNDTRMVSFIAMPYAPYGDLGELVLKGKIADDLILVRTIFRKIVEGIAYFHSRGAAHLDLKLENILIGEKFEIMITDFDSSFLKGDHSIKGRGTINYRAPELLKKGIEIDPQAADIFSLGIILFCLAQGNLPYIENGLVDGVDLQKLILTKNLHFWSLHAEITKGTEIQDSELRDLFYKMVSEDPKERLTIAQVKDHPWFKGPYYTDENIYKNLMKRLVQAKIQY